MEFSGKTFTTRSTGKQTELVEYFLNRSQPVQLEITTFDQCAEWCGELTRNLRNILNRFEKNRFSMYFKYYRIYTPVLS